MRVLLVEDDLVISRALASHLEAAGFRVECCSDGQTAWTKGHDEDFDAVILDLGLPRLDGLSVLKRWRQEGRAMPVIILSARGSWAEKVDGIEAGGDDYLAKPFEPAELIARLRGLLRRAAGRTGNVVTAGRLSLDLFRATAQYDGAAVRLSPLEFRLLDLLANAAGRPLSAGEIGEHLHGSDVLDANAVEALVARLRRKTGPDVIETRRGFGYVLGGLTPT
ncbi:transcriptional regulatory protein QseB [Candidatus Phycosocius bacilliformis]|uniref:Transcriptional regulatory protein QseB n=1 Tax=Candidatus Phycosocius bacilliformis TaxID=1445552 RepID=A0A2P2EE44_9PROT|nr:response regulator transcription factor [Candidatus Phycosocius bacilliformis]GBF59321.1 transcriptional regulatory protein QseB [Candidatus Phycosocius bacilliformis]